MERAEATEAIKRKARALGFERVGIANAERTPHADSFLDWLNQGRQGEMEYLRRSAAERMDIQKVLPGAKSVVCVAKNYFTKDVFSGSGTAPRGAISRYAWGDDYHEVVGEGLKRLAEFMENGIAAQTRGTVATKWYVDTGPVLEREYAAQAGVGWIGKNTCVIDPERGSYYFLGEVITTLELAPDTPMSDHCGNCTLCIQACPTGALAGPYELDARKCISYLTIEHRDEIPAGIRPAMDHHIYGCDICQEVCPWNSGAKPTDDRRFHPRPGFEHVDLQEWAEMTEEEYRRRLKNSPMKRAKYEGLMRNIRVAMENARGNK
ncbi:MAG: tRNA epoxyqueuosine(34) reductase QueG [bacterium]